MNKKRIYQIATTVIVLFIIGLFSWYIFINKETGSLTNTLDLGYFENTDTGESGRSIGGIFGSVFGDDSDVVVPVKKAASLQRLHTEPVTGVTAVANASTTVARFVEKSTGHVFETPLTENTVTRISNTTIPRIQEARWVNANTGVIFRYLNEETERIVSFYKPIATDGEEDDGVYLEDNIRQLEASRDGSEIVYLLSTLTGTRAVRAKPDGTNPEEIWVSGLRAWYLQLRDNTPYVTQSPSHQTTGYTYQINPDASMQKIIGDIFALSSNISPDGTSLLFSSVQNGEIVLSIYNMTSRTTTVLPFQTLAEKCTWSTLAENILYCGIPSNIPAAEYPDDWYQGIQSFSDALWRIDVSSGTGTEIVFPEQTRSIPVDVIDIFLDETETYLFFINKKDHTPWVVTVV